MCECEDEVCNKKDDLPEDVLQGLHGEEDNAVFVDEVRLKLREHYRELAACASAVAGMAKVVAPEAPGGLACEAQRRAVAACYRCHRGETLCCDAAVQRFAACVRLHNETFVKRQFDDQTKRN